MSRIGKKPIAIPSGVEVKIENNLVTVKGPKGTESVAYRDEVKVSVVENNIIVEPNSDDRKTGALHGLFRTLIANAVEGVSKGFEKKLEIVGVGYRAQLQGDTLVVNGGYSHPVNMKLPQGITVTCPLVSNIAYSTSPILNTTTPKAVDKYRKEPSIYVS